MQISLCLPLPAIHARVSRDRTHRLIHDVPRSQPCKKVKRLGLVFGHLPERCPYAPEKGMWRTDELRRLLSQDYPLRNRILFTVTSSRVHILNTPHGARRYLHEEEDVRALEPEQQGSCK